MRFIHDDFLLETEAARELYHTSAKDQPILDYHCHLPPEAIAANHQFDNLFDIWLAGDHYKWRAMRTNGEPESLCTGDADPYDKFLAFARTVPATLRNPLYHWTHLELKRYFDIDELLDESTAPAIWETANAQLATESCSVYRLLEQFKVQLVGTTDDPTDDLQHHRKIAQSDCPAKVVPTFRPDKGIGIHNSEVWNPWVDALSDASGVATDTLSGFLSALDNRIQFFAENGCLASDHGLESCPTVIASEQEAQAIYASARSGQLLSKDDADRFAGFLLCWLGERYAELGWAMQLHLGPLRNVNAGLFAELGPDIGCDSISDVDQIAGLKCLLGELSVRGKLPKTILYNLNPAQNYAFATMCGNFSEAGVPGKMQFGSGWWFLDQLEGMTWQLNALSSLGLLSHFIGMLTDSRSFMSFPRHEYFRRLLCDLIGKDLEKGHLPKAMLPRLHQLVSDVSFGNAKRYFGLD